MKKKKKKKQTQQEMIKDSTILLCDKNLHVISVFWEPFLLCKCDEKIKFKVFKSSSVLTIKTEKIEPIDYYLHPFKIRVNFFFFQTLFLGFRDLWSVHSIWIDSECSTEYGRHTHAWATLRQLSRWQLFQYCCFYISTRNLQSTQQRDGQRSHIHMCIYAPVQSKANTRTHTIPNAYTR